MLITELYQRVNELPKPKQVQAIINCLLLLSNDEVNAFLKTAVTGNNMLVVLTALSVKDPSTWIFEMLLACMETSHPDSDEWLLAIAYTHPDQAIRQLAHEAL